MSRGVLLYGPPASGKDTVTRALAEADSRFSLFHRLKCGPGSRAGYRMTTAEQLAQLDSHHDVIWSNQQYGATYVIDRAGLTEHLDRAIPVVHVGQPAAVDAVLQRTPGTRWWVVALWCPRDVAAQRLQERETTDPGPRLDVWDSTPPLALPATTINTADYAPAAVAYLITTAVSLLSHA
jgi:guanylate kinase